MSLHRSHGTENRWCDTCQSINAIDEVLHHCYKDLKVTASAGCSLCQVLLGLYASTIDYVTYLRTAEVPKDGARRSILYERTTERARILMVNGNNSLQVVYLAQRKVYELFRRRETKRLGQELIHGLEIYPDPQSDACFDVAISWLLVCLAVHDRCQQGKKYLPALILDITEENPFLCSGRGMTSPYTILSHCWGSRPLLTTTMATIKDRMHGIPCSRLPKTFQDAITITKQFGVKYLWVDSLCIIQDNAQDWVEESVKMGDYYRNALFTISALEAANSGEGVLGQRQPVSLAGANGTEISEITAMEENLFLRAQSPPWADIFSNAALSKRAWALQERLLSTRILHYSKTEMFWECNTCSAREGSALRHLDSHPAPTPTMEQMSSQQEAESFKRVLWPFLDPRTSRREARALTFKIWYPIVEQYTRKALTKSTDKLPAIEGAASIIRSATGLAYLAGLWEEDLHRGLLWEIDVGISNSAKPAIPADAARWRAPSWSWAASDVPIYFRADKQSLFEPAFSDRTQDAKLLGSSKGPSSGSENPISIESITLRAWTRPIFYSTYATINYNSCNIDRANKVGPSYQKGGFLGDATLDVTIPETGQWRGEIIWVCKRVFNTNIMGEFVPVVYFILVEAVGPLPNTYKRIGQGKTSAFYRTNNYEDPFAGWTERDVTLI